MVAAAQKLQDDPFQVLRLYHQTRLTGFSLSVQAGRLLVEPLSGLAESQRAAIVAHKPALVALLADVATLSALLATAGAAGIAAGEPPGWDWERRYVALDVLIANGHARFVLGRHYAAAHAPVIDWEAVEERAAIMEYDGGLDRNKAEQLALARVLAAPPLAAPPVRPSPVGVYCGNCRHAVLPPNADPSNCFYCCGLGTKGGFARELRRCTHFEAAP